MDESNLGRPARDGFNPDSSRTGAKVEKPDLGDSWGNYVEESLAETIRSRPHFK